MCFCEHFWVYYVFSVWYKLKKKHNEIACLVSLIELKWKKSKFSYFRFTKLFFKCAPLFSFILLSIGWMCFLLDYIPSLFIQYKRWTYFMRHSVYENENNIIIVVNNRGKQTNNNRYDKHFFRFLLFSLHSKSIPVKYEHRIELLSIRNSHNQFEEKGNAFR